jgi:hypothetical protein
MTEQKTQRFVSEVSELFEMCGTDYQEAIGADLVKRTPEELAWEFRKAVDLFRGLEYTAESAVGYGAYLILGEARGLAEIAQYICEEHAQGEA